MSKDFEDALSYGMLSMTTTQTTSYSKAMTANSLRDAARALAQVSNNSQSRYDDYYGRCYCRYGPGGPADPNCCPDYQRRYHQQREMEYRFEQILQHMQHEMLKSFELRMSPVMMVSGTDKLVRFDGTKEKTMSSVAEKIRALALNKDEKVLRKFGVKNESGEWTEEAQEILLDILMEERKDEIVAKVKQLDAEETKKKGKK